MQPIVLATDLTTSSSYLTQYATQLTALFQTELILFHAYQIPVAFSELPVVTLTLDEIKKDAEIKLEEIKKGIKQNSNFQFEITIELVLGEPATELERFANKNKPLFIVMGPGSHNTLERAFVGSTTIHTMKHINYPILIVPKDAANLNYKKIGFACDFVKKIDAPTIKFIQILIEKTKTELYILHVEDNVQNQIQSLNQMEVLEQFKNENPVFQNIKHNSVEEGLEKFASQEKIDILIIRPRKHSLIHQLFHKSNTSNLIFHSHIPVLSLHE